jgi:hypothetical protein
VDSYGRIMTTGPFANTDDEHAEKIHIEAVTDEAWQDLKDKKAAKDAPKPNKYLADIAAADSRRGGAEGTPAVDGEAAADEPLIKITLKAKGHSDIKIKVRPVSFYPSLPYVIFTNVAPAEYNFCQDDQCSTTEFQTRC